MTPSKNNPKHAEGPVVFKDVHFHVRAEKERTRPPSLAEISHGSKADLLNHLEPLAPINRHKT